MSEARTAGSRPARARGSRRAHTAGSQRAHTAGSRRARTRGSRQERAGGVILTVASVVAGLLVIAAVSYASGTGQRSAAALAAAGCEPTLGSETGPCVTQPMLARQYMAVLTPASRQMNLDAAAYSLNQDSNLATAEAALTAEVTTERALDTSLAGIKFPPAITPLAQALIRADAALAKLTSQQARSATLTRMRSYDQRVQAASSAVQAEMNLVREAVDTPVRAHSVG